MRRQIKRLKQLGVFFMYDFLGGDFYAGQQTKKLNTLFQKSEFGLQFPKPTSKIIDLAEINQFGKKPQWDNKHFS